MLYFKDLQEIFAYQLKIINLLIKNNLFNNMIMNTAINSLMVY